MMIDIEGLKARIRNLNSAAFSLDEKLFLLASIDMRFVVSKFMGELEAFNTEIGRSVPDHGVGPIPQEVFHIKAAAYDAAAALEKLAKLCGAK